ncbi:MAG: serine hydrolase [Holosporales bacterium]|jgi:CubicO group peptidase (beta-lactamase class C family)|nr:serine hydrolase [Holosporales bacterium]
MFRCLLKFFALFASLVSFSQLCSAKLTDAELLEKAKTMEQIIADGIKKVKIPGATLVVARNGKMTHMAVLGKTTLDSNNPEPITKTTLFPISSITKNITAILVGSLVDEGIISFDDKVRKYLPDFFVTNEELSNEFTILDLISFRSGFKNFSADSLFRAGYGKQKCLDAFKYLKQKPGEYRKYYGYQNVIFGVVGDVIEKATGEKYEDLVKKYIFDKMDMKTSSAIRLDFETSRVGHFKYLLSRFSHDKVRLGFFKAAWNLILDPFKFTPKKKVISHSRYVDEVIPLEEVGIFHTFSATSGISFSAEDFAKWVEMLISKGSYRGQQIVSQKTFEFLATPKVTMKKVKDDDYTFIKSRYVREGLSYCSGMFKTKYGDEGKNAKEILFHMGGIYGACAFFAVAPQDDFSVGVIINFGGTAITLFPEYMVNQCLDLCFGFSKIDWVQKEIERKDYYKQKQRSYRADLSEKNPTPMEKPEKYVGTYKSDMYGKIKVTEADGKLYISNGIKSAKLAHINGSMFEFPSKDMCFVAFDESEYASFFKDEYGNTNSLYLSCFDENNAIFQKQQ